MRIVFLSQEYPSFPPRGGIGSYVQILGRALVRAGHEVHVLSARNEAPRDVIDEGVQVHLRDIGPSRWPRKLARYRRTRERLDVSRACRRELGNLPISPDVVEAPDWMAEGLAMPRKVPIVVTLHSPIRMIQRYNQLAASTDLKIADQLERLAVRRATVITSPSNALLELLKAERWLPLERSSAVIPHPMDIPTVEPRGAERTTPLVLSIGRLEVRKGPDLLIAAAGELAEKVPGLTVIFIGRAVRNKEGREFEARLRSAAELSAADVRFVEETEPAELRSWYEKARVVAVPSLWESFSVVAAEAMSYGRAVVCSSMTGIGEIIEGSDAGRVFRAGDPHDLARSLLPFLSDGDMGGHAGRAARKLIRERCDADSIASMRGEIYARAIEVHHPP